MPPEAIMVIFFVVFVVIGALIMAPFIAREAEAQEEQGRIIAKRAKCERERASFITKEDDQLPCRNKIDYEPRFQYEREHRSTNFLRHKNSKNKIDGEEG